MEPDLTNYYEQQPKPTFSSNLIEFIQTLIVFLAIILVIYLFVARPHRVSGPSMLPTFKDGDYIISEKVSYELSQPHRGDVIVFKDPKNESVDFIKRIIGLPGERVKVENDQVYINDQSLNESYLQPDVITQGRTFMPDGKEIEVPQNEFLVFGDNREMSSDSREWGFITRNEIIGKVVLRYWPLNTFGINPGNVKAQ